MALPTRPPELRHLRIFVAVAETLHFGRAAERVGMAQPPLSQQIARLEALIGHALFVRSRSGPARVALTEAGETLLPLARRLLESAEAALDAARAAARGEQGALTVAFVGSLARSALPEALRRYRADYPGVRMTLREMTTARMINALGEGEIDIGIGREVETRQSLAAIELARETLLFACSKSHPLAVRASIRPGELADEKFVLPPLSAGEAFHRRLIAPCIAAGFAPHVAQEAVEWSTVLALVGAGFGITIAPASALEGRPPEIAVGVLDAPSAHTTIHLCVQAATPSQTRDNFVNHLIAAFSQAA